ncbi:MAG: long-chain-fatty-acid--CoA ligase, partial [Bdellovibrionota bacterium]
MENIWVKNYEKGVPAEINPLEYNNIAHILDDVFKRFSGQPSFHNMGTTLTYDQLRVASLKFASYLQNELKLEKGSRV